MSVAAEVNRPSRPTRARVGITGRGVVVLILLVTAVAGAGAVLAGGHRGHAFGIAFVATAAVGALLVRRKDIVTAMIAPPLLYCLLVVLMSFIDTKGQTGGLLTRKAVYVADAFITGAPAIWTGTALAAAIGWYRRRNAAPRIAPPAATPLAPPRATPMAAPSATPASAPEGETETD
jgi:hypothetical protein